MSLVDSYREKFFSAFMLIGIDDINIVITVDSNDIKVTNRGQWMSDKWNIQNKKEKGYHKIHVAVANIKTRDPSCYRG